MFLRSVCCSKTLKYQANTISTSSTCLKNHYDVLGITPKATQNDIKTAFYKLSMEYHPDKNKGSPDASKKFQDISGAYEVLGNYKLRRLYDKGILHTAGPEFAQAESIVEDEHPEEKFYRSRMDRHQAPTMSGKTPIYDFDEWSKAHYGATFARANRERDKRAQRKEKLAKETIDKRNEKVIGTIMIFILAVLLMGSTKEDLDISKK